MKKNNYLFYSQFLKGEDFSKYKILMSKTKTSYLIGPLLNQNFDSDSFFKRLISNSIYTVKSYKKISYNKCDELFKKYYNNLLDNEVIEVFNNKTIIKHQILKVPGDSNE